MPARNEVSSTQTALLGRLDISRLSRPLRFINLGIYIMVVSGIGATTRLVSLGVQGNASASEVFGAALTFLVYGWCGVDRMEERRHRQRNSSPADHVGASGHRHLLRRSRPPDLD